MREVVIRALDQQGYKLVTASRPQEALALIESNPTVIDLLVTDVVMPDMNGPELATILRDRYRGLGVIYMSGYPQQLLEKEDLEATGSVFIQKPVRLSALVEQVRKVLDIRNDSPSRALDR